MTTFPVETNSDRHSCLYEDLLVAVRKRLLASSLTCSRETSYPFFLYNTLPVFPKKVPLVYSVLCCPYIRNILLYKQLDGE